MSESLGFSEDWSAEVQKTGGQAGVHDLMQTGYVQKSDLFAKFHMKAVHMKALSEKAGRPIYEDKLYISVYMPGGDTVVRPIKPTDKAQWPDAWAAYERGQAEAVSGTPIEQWPAATPSVVAMFKAKNIFNVEGCAAMSDAQCETLGNYAFDFRRKAQQYLAHAEGNDTRIEELQAENATLAEQLKEMQAAIAEMQKPKRRGPKPGTKYKRKAKPDVSVDDDPKDNEPAVPTDTQHGNRQSESAGPDAP